MPDRYDPPRYDPPTDPVVWQARPPAGPDQVPDHYATGSWYPDYPSGYDEPPGEARSHGLRRLSKLTWRATQLSAVAAVGFAALFAHTAHSYAASTTTHLKPTAKPTTASPSPSPSATKKHHKHHHHSAAAAAAAAPAAGGGSSGSGASGGSAPSSAPAAAPPPPAPPTTAPAPPPPAPSPPPPTSSGGSQGGG
jgi:hypothetical protein